jgi:hypothetical protein
MLTIGSPVFYLPAFPFRAFRVWHQTRQSTIQSAPGLRTGCIAGKSPLAGELPGGTPDARREQQNTRQSVEPIPLAENVS